MSNYLENFKKARAAAQLQMSGEKSQNRRIFAGSNELPLCGSKNVGMTFGVFLMDKNDLPYRIINGYRSFRINKEVAEKYDIKNYVLRVCDTSQYIRRSPDGTVGLGEEDLKLVETLNKLLEKVSADWAAWEGKISKYPPQWSRHMTLQYMKVLRRAGLDGTEIQGFEPGVKVLMSRSDAYYRRFEGYIEDQVNISGNLDDVIREMMSRDQRVRNTQFMLKAVLPPNVKSYEFTLQQIPRITELTDDDLKLADDLNREVVDITYINADEMRKWIRMFKDTYDFIRTGVMNDPQPATDSKVHEEVASTPVVESQTEEDDPFGPPEFN